MNWIDWLNIELTNCADAQRGAAQSYAAGRCGAERRAADRSLGCAARRRYGGAKGVFTNEGVQKRKSNNDDNETIKQ